MGQPQNDDDGHSFNGPPTWGHVNVAYLVLGVVYTGLLLVMMCILWANRFNPAVKIRGYWVMFFSVLTIQAYVAALFITYPLNGAFSCGSEFWIMNTIFPFGIAMFQVSNVRLYSKFDQQRRLMHDPASWSEKEEPDLKFSLSGWMQWFKDRTLVQKTYLVIFGCGILQVVVTLILYWGSRRFTPPSAYYEGWFGHVVGPMECRRGPEWIPSVVWQFMSAWILGPIVLYRTRFVRDTHLWALQTRVSVFASLPGTPLWLAFLYGPNETMATINKWWPPALWFAPGLMTMQLSLLVTALIDIHNTVAPRRPFSFTYSYLSSDSSSPRSSISKRGSRKSHELANNKEAFKFQLNHNVEPLLEFAAKRDFTAENIQFLCEVRDFKDKWTQASNQTVFGSYLTPNDEQKMWLEAGLLYFELIDPETSACNINIDHVMLFELRHYFRNLVYYPPLSTSSMPPINTENLVCPWETSISRRHTADSPNSASRIVGSGNHSDDITPVETNEPRGGLGFPVPGSDPLSRATSSSSSYPLAVPKPANTIARLQHFDASRGTVDVKVSGPHEEAMKSFSVVPTGFDVNVFDKAERAIEYLVYMNTWKNYVETLGERELWAYANPNVLSDHIERSTRFNPKPSTASSLKTGHSSLGLKKAHGNPHENCEEEMHNGVLDDGPVPMSKVNAQCACCRDKRGLPIAGRTTKPSPPQVHVGKSEFVEVVTETSSEDTASEAESAEKVESAEALRRAKLREYAQKRFLKADELAEIYKREEKRNEVLKSRSAEYKDLHKAFVKRFGCFR